jgi:hypothetical protein
MEANLGFTFKINKECRVKIKVVLFVKQTLLITQVAFTWRAISFIVARGFPTMQRGRLLK